VDRELQKLIDQLKQAGVDTSAFEAQFRNANRTVGESQKLLETMNTTLNGVIPGARGLNTQFSDLRENLVANLSELAKTNNAVNQGVKSYRGLTSIVQQLAS